MFEISQLEIDQALTKYFTSAAPLRLKHYPKKQKQKYLVLYWIAKCFEKEKKYSEKEINSIILEVTDDFVTIRRALYDYGFIDRVPDGSCYWLR
ncbi:MAG: DUF2087 domain-containing protein [Bacilli bacterium]|jgi:hypothetical protein|nr:DUF2087 domain-containing protein [Bacilli bacterium]MDY0064086.1 DUF2087 domain-containing protein [Bacilli bacterium]